MKRVIRLTESDLARIVRRVIKEENEMSKNGGDLNMPNFKAGDNVLIKLRTPGNSIGSLIPSSFIIVKITETMFNEPGNVTNYFTVTNVTNFGDSKIKVGDKGHLEIWYNGDYSLSDNSGRTIQNGKHSDLIKK